MSTEARALAERGPLLLGAGVLSGIGFGALLYFGFGLDLLAFSGWGLPCPFHAITGLACPGCGMTRALVLVSQLQWQSASEMNAFVFPVLGFSAWTLRERFRLRSGSNR